GGDGLVGLPPVQTVDRVGRVRGCGHRGGEHDVDPVEDLAHAPADPGFGVARGGERRAGEHPAVAGVVACAAVEHGGVVETAAPAVQAGHRAGQEVQAQKKTVAGPVEDHV